MVETGVNALSVDAGVESCRLLEGRSSNFENNGPLHSGQLFPVREPGFQRELLDGYFLSGEADLRAEPLTTGAR